MNQHDGRDVALRLQRIVGELVPFDVDALLEFVGLLQQQPGLLGRFVTLLRLDSRISVRLFVEDVFGIPRPAVLALAAGRDNRTDSGRISVDGWAGRARRSAARVAFLGGIIVAVL